MPTIKAIILRILTTSMCLISMLTSGSGSISNESHDYRKYHAQINEAEKLISDGHFNQALNLLDEVFISYDYVFLRDYKIAAQLALYLEEREKAFRYVKEGIVAGWDLKSIRRNQYLSQLKNFPEWKTIEATYPDLQKKHQKRIDKATREIVQKMFKKDQWKALGALLRIGNKAQEKYALKKFAPHSEAQIKKLINILKSRGYPGERLIGNSFWMSTILSHHNSITQEYVKRDTLYNFIRPMLIKAIEKGQMSPYEYALIDDWHKAVSSGRTEPGYGFLNPPQESTLNATNQLRKEIGLRTIELRNKLVDIEHETGMNFYLPDWVEGKIQVEQK